MKGLERLSVKAIMAQLAELDRLVEQDVQLLKDEIAWANSGIKNVLGPAFARELVRESATLRGDWRRALRLARARESMA